MKKLFFFFVLSYSLLIAIDFSFLNIIELNSNYLHQNDNSIFYAEEHKFSYPLSWGLQGDFDLSKNLLFNFREKFSFDLKDQKDKFYLYSLNLEYFSQDNLIFTTGKNTMIYSNSENWDFCDLYSEKYSRNEVSGYWMAKISFRSFSLFYIPQIKNSSYKNLADQDKEIAGIVFSQTVKNLNFNLLSTYNTNDNLQNYSLCASYSHPKFKSVIFQLDSRFSQPEKKYSIKETTYYSYLYSEEKENFYNQSTFGIKALLPEDFDITLEYCYNQLGYSKSEYDNFIDKIQSDNIFRQVSTSYLATLNENRLDLCRHYLGISLNKQNFWQKIDVNLGSKINVYDFSYQLYNENTYNLTDDYLIKSTISWQNGKSCSEFNQKFYNLYAELKLLWYF